MGRNGSLLFTLPRADGGATSPTIERHGSGFYVDTDDGQSHTFPPVILPSRPDGVDYDDIPIGVAHEVAMSIANVIKNIAGALIVCRLHRPRSIGVFVG